MSSIKYLLLLLIVLFSGACSQAEPWVKPYERANLAEPVMDFNRDPVSGAYLNHVYEAREGARGAGVGSGGGCGCN